MSQYRVPKRLVPGKISETLIQKLFVISIFNRIFFQLVEICRHMLTLSKKPGAAEEEKMPILRQ